MMGGGGFRPGATKERPGATKERPGATKEPPTRSDQSFFWSRQTNCLIDQVGYFFSSGPMLRVELCHRAYTHLLAFIMFFSFSSSGQMWEITGMIILVPKVGVEILWERRN